MLWYGATQLITIYLFQYFVNDASFADNVVFT
jgi:hypothetical protein